MMRAQTEEKLYGILWNLGQHAFSDLGLEQTSLSLQYEVKIYSHVHAPLAITCDSVDIKLLLRVQFVQHKQPLTTTHLTRMTCAITGLNMKAILCIITLQGKCHYSTVHV